jgi:hypothetical protein
MNKENIVYIHNRIFKHKKNEILSFVDKWMELEDIMLNEISQKKISTACSFFHVETKIY